MLMRTREHNAKTTFVGGVNPWGEYTPPEARISKAGRPYTSQSSVLYIFMDGLPRTNPDIRKLTGASQTTVHHILHSLVDKGLLKQGMKKIKGIRPIPEYWLAT